MIDPPDRVRVVACKQYAFEFLHEPMPAVRMNYKARFTAKEGSPEWLYVRWKDAMRDLFDQLDYRDHSIGVPFDEPISVSGMFLISNNPEVKDLDNLVKAIFDSMNPVRRKDFSHLRTFTWVDDRQVKQFGRWAAIPSRDPRIMFTVTPLWGRADPELHYIDGMPLDMGHRIYLMNTAMDYPFHCVVPKGLDAPVCVAPHDGVTQECRMWVITSSTRGIHTVGNRPEQALLFRELVKQPRVSEDLALQIFDVEWGAVVEAFAKSSPAGLGLSTRAEKALGGVMSLFDDPEKRMIELAEKFDQTVFDQTAALVSQRAKVTWSNVRKSLVSVDLDWRAGLETVIDDAMKVIEEQHVRKSKPRKAKPNAAKARRRSTT